MNGLLIFIGFFIVMGSVGADEYALMTGELPPHILVTIGKSLIGLVLMAVGAYRIAVEKS